LRETIVRTSSQVEFRVSHNSDVSEPRTARAFSRAARRQLKMLPLNSRSRLTNSNTARGSMRSWRSRYGSSMWRARMVALKESASVSPECGSSDIR
jgi:hypothetical protein